MDQLTLGVGTRLQHTQFGPGVIVGVRYATYLISFLNMGIKEIEKTDTALDEIIPENVTPEIETVSISEVTFSGIISSKAVSVFSISLTPMLKKEIR